MLFFELKHCADECSNQEQWYGQEAVGGVIELALASLHARGDRVAAHKRGINAERHERVGVYVTADESQTQRSPPFGPESSLNGLF